MAPSLQIKLLGTPEILYEGTSGPRFILRKSLALLSYLCMTTGDHSRALLANLLWSEYTEVNARAGLRKVVAELRTQVNPHCLIENNSIAFNHAAPYVLDVELFEQPLARLRVDPSWANTSEAIAALTSAVTLYRGEFMAGFQVHRAPVFEEWVTLQRERLRLEALQMLFLLASMHLSQGAYPQVIAWCEQILDLEPYHEEALRLFMKALALNDQSAAAERLYHAFRERMHQELGLPVHEDTRALYHHICNTRADITSPHEYSRRLLPPPYPLLGRKSELEELLAIL